VSRQSHTPTRRSTPNTDSTSCKYVRHRHRHEQHLTSSNKASLLRNFWKIFHALAAETRRGPTRADTGNLATQIWKICEASASETRRDHTSSDADSAVQQMLNKEEEQPDPLAPLDSGRHVSEGPVFCLIHLPPHAQLYSHQNQEKNLLCSFVLAFPDAPRHFPMP
jgi:hypothetical protein